MRIINSMVSRISRLVAEQKFDRRLKKLAESRPAPVAAAGPVLHIGFLSQPGSFGSVVELLLAMLFRFRGHRVTIVYADESFPLMECHKHNNPSGWVSTTRRNTRRFKRMADLLGMAATPASEILSIGTTELSNEDNKLIRDASLLKHYRVGRITESLHDIENRRKLISVSIKRSYNIGNYFSNENRVDRLIMNHGLYATTGPARLVALKNGVEVLTFDRAKRKRCLNFSWELSSDQWSIDQVWATEGEIGITKDQEIALEKYLNTRIMHSDDVYVYNRGLPSSAGTLRDELGIKKNTKVVVLFTNVLWDAASADRDIVFNNPVDWVEKTIEFVADHRELMHLVVRIHPAELVIGTNDGFSDIIRKKFLRLPSNVTVLPPDSEINSWTLYELADIGVVHTTTAGLEMALRNKPVIVVSKTHYRDKGFTEDPVNAKEYFELLGHEGEESRINRQVALAKKYAYLMFIKYQYQFPFVDFSDAGNMVLNEIQFKKLSDHPQIVNLISSIVNRTPILNPPNNLRQK